MSVEALLSQLRACRGNLPLTLAQQAGLNAAINQCCSQNSAGELNLSGHSVQQHFIVQDYLNLFKVLENNTTVKSLNLYYLNPNLYNQHDILKALCKVLARNSTLTSLNLSNSLLTGYTAIDLLQALNANPNTALKSLDLSRNEISFDIYNQSVYTRAYGFVPESRSKLAQALLNTKTLETISFENNKMNTRSAFRGLKFFLEHLSQNSSLRQCNLDGNPIIKWEGFSDINIQNEVSRKPDFLGKELQETLEGSANFFDASKLGKLFSNTPLPLEVSKIVNEYLNFPEERFAEGFNNPDSVLEIKSFAEKEKEKRAREEQAGRAKEEVTQAKRAKEEQAQRASEEAAQQAQRIREATQAEKVQKETKEQLQIKSNPVQEANPEKTPEPIIQSEIPVTQQAQTNKKMTLKVLLQRGGLALVLGGVILGGVLFGMGLPVLAGILLGGLVLGGVVLYGLSKTQGASNTPMASPFTQAHLNNPPPQKAAIIEESPLHSSAAHKVNEQSQQFKISSEKKQIKRDKP